MPESKKLLTLEQWLETEQEKIDNLRNYGMINDCGRIQRGEPDLTKLDADFLLWILEEEKQPLVFLNLLEAFQTKDPRFSWEPQEEVLIRKLADNKKNQCRSLFNIIQERR